MFVKNFRDNRFWPWSWNRWNSFNIFLRYRDLEFFHFFNSVRIFNEQYLPFTVHSYKPSELKSLLIVMISPTVLEIYCTRDLIFIFNSAPCSVLKICHFKKRFCTKNIAQIIIFKIIHNCFFVKKAETHSKPAAFIWDQSDYSVVGLPNWTQIYWTYIYMSLYGRSGGEV